VKLLILIRLLSSVALSSLVAQSAVVFTNVTTFEWLVDDAQGAFNSGSDATTNAPQSTISRSVIDGSANVTVQGNLDLSGGGSSVSLTHVNNGVLQNFQGPHRLRSILTQELGFLAEAGDGSLQINGTLGATVGAGTPGTAFASLRFINLTTGAVLLDRSQTNSQGVPIAFLNVPLVAGNSYQIKYLTDLEKNAPTFGFGGNINGGGTMTFGLTGGGDFRFEAIPEPGTSVSLFVAVAAGALRRRRHP
jgi:hypothetical protein